MKPEPQAFFLPADPAAAAGGQRFCVHHPAQGEHLRGRIVYAHPFAEEMNKTRRMAALQARAFAAAGYSVLQIDLHGCGDSSGDFADASWQAWIDDLVAASSWLRERDEPHRQAPLWLWGLRSGCLLISAALTQLAAGESQALKLCLWQPSSAGKLLLQQFMRLRLAADLAGGQSRGQMEAMRQQLQAGQAVDIAGYLLAPGLALGLEAARLLPPEPATLVDRLEWFEISSRSDAELSPVATQALAAWSAGGSRRVRSHLIQGPAFWQTSEIEDAPALIEASTAALS